MKRFFLISFSALAAFCSCTRETPVEPVMKLEASFADEVRTSLSGTKVVWSEDDAIVVNGSASTAIKISQTNPSSAEFTLPVLNAPYYAIYPASDYVTNSYRPSLAKYGSVTLSEEQTYVEGSFDPSSAVMVGKQTESGAGIDFHHAMAFIRFTVSGTASSAKIKSVCVSAIGGEDMSGNFDFKPASLSISGGSNGKGVKLLSTAGVAQGKSMLVAIPARTYASGLKVRVIDVTNHYMDIRSTKSFEAAAGTVYSTTVNYAPNGTIVGVDAGGAEESEAGITPYWELNQGDEPLNSHAGAFSKSMLTYVGNSYVQLGENVTNLPMVIYPRFIRTNDGRWLLFYHNGIYDSSRNVYTWAGTECYCLESYDMKHWSGMGKIFAREYNVPSPHGGTFQRIYAGAHPLRLPDGRLMVVASYRRSGDFRHKLMDNGLAFRYSSDEGRSWSETQFINIGTNWEPRPIVLSSGRIVVYYTDSCPYVEGVWESPVVSSGSSYIYSDDNGATWKPNDPLNNHLWAFRQLRDSKSGTNVYTDQMPGVIELNNSKQLVAVAEANHAKCDATTSDYWVSMAWSDSNGNWGSPDANGVMPSDRNNKAYKGAAPTIEQFRSGETVITYNNNNIFYMAFGDESGRNFLDPVRVFGTSSADYPKGHGFWGSCLADGHVLLIGTAGEGGSAGSGFFIEVGQYYLNHNITASARAAEVDGKNREWKGTDQALFVGSNGNMHATLRASVSGGVLYLLAEMDGAAMAGSDYVRVYLANPSNTTIKAGDVYLQSNPSGSLGTYRNNGSSWASAGLNASAAAHKGNGFYIVEFSVPVSSLPSSSALLVNFVVSDSVDGVQSLRTVPASTTASKNTSTWQKLNLQ